MALRITGSVIGEPITSSSTSATGMWTSQEVAALQKDGIWQIAPTFTLTPSASNVNEGASITITLTTTGIPNGAVVPYAITGTNVNANDSANGILTGNFVIQNGSNTISFAANADSTLEGPEILIITAGTASANVTINDTSTGLDVQFPYTTLLLNGDGTNNAQNNTFLDSSTNNFTMTRNGNATQGAFTPYGANWGNYFDGTGDYLTTPASSITSIIGTSQLTTSSVFTIECWINQTSRQSHPDAPALVGDMLPTAATNNWSFGPDADGLLSFCWNSINYYVKGNTIIPLNTWTHIALVINAGNIKLFVNGVLQTLSGAFQTITASVATNGYITIGQWNSGGSLYGHVGHVSNLRIVKSALYSTNFVPSTSPLTTVANTGLLTCQSNRFIDNSTNNFTVTKNGDTTVQRFSPFSPTFAYNANTYGGAAYFDGSGDYLSVSYNSALALGSGSTWTIEYWLYFNAAFGTYTPISHQQDSTVRWDVEHAAASTVLLFDNSTITTFTHPSTLVPYAWYHIAFVRDGTTVRMYVNGVASSTTSTNNLSNVTSGSLGIGRNEFGGAYFFYMNGYISDVRLVKGAAVYTGNFTPPTAPVAISGSASATSYTNTANVNTTFASSVTSLLCNFTNAGIYDSAMMNIFETVADSKVSTTQSKFGGSALFFDGTGDYLYSPSRPNLTFATGDFTIEMWVNPTSLSATLTFLLGMRPATTNGFYPVIYADNTGTYWYVNSVNRISGGVLSTGAWTHLAVCRSGGSTKMFFNGTQTGGTFTDSSNYLMGRLYIGASDFNSGTAEYLTGYLDDYRITKGYARYTSTFTPPTRTLPGY